MKGETGKTVSQSSWRHPRTIVALAYFDLDLTEPTKSCLRAIAPRLTEGSMPVVWRVELSGFPGETLAVTEVVGLRNLRVLRIPKNRLISYAVIES